MKKRFSWWPRNKRLVQAMLTIISVEAEATQSHQSGCCLWRVYAYLGLWSNRMQPQNDKNHESGEKHPSKTLLLISLLSTTTAPRVWFLALLPNGVLLLAISLLSHYKYSSLYFISNHSITPHSVLLIPLNFVQQLLSSRPASNVQIEGKRHGSFLSLSQLVRVLLGVSGLRWCGEMFFGEIEIKQTKIIRSSGCNVLLPSEFIRLPLVTSNTNICT
jgi:hypothetical protein